MDMEVDIISMSWSFKKTSSDDHYESKFRNLIDQAVKKNILLFASLPDKPLEETSQYAPVSLEGVIKIGSATVFGEPSRENMYAQLDFLLPGEGITLSTGEPAKGSSFSTAYASGLAASLLYCLRAHRVLIEPGDGSLTYEALNMAKTSQGMKGIFKRLGRSLDSTSDAVFFIQPHHQLSGEYGVSLDGIKEHLKNIVNLIAPSEDLRVFKKLMLRTA